MEETVKERLERFISAKQISKREFERRISVSNGYINGLKYTPKPNVLEKIILQFPELSRGWLLTGEGDMLKESLGSVDVADGFPLYNIEASANLVSLFDGNGDVKNVVGRLLIPNAPKCDGAIYVRGDSMEPLLKSGDIIAYKSLPNEYSSILYGEMYIVDFEVGGEDFVAVKFLHRSDKGEEWVKLTSYNEFYEPKDIHLSCVRSLALVKFSIRMNTIC